MPPDLDWPCGGPHSGENGYAPVRPHRVFAPLADGADLTAGDHRALGRVFIEYGSLACLPLTLMDGEAAQSVADWPRCDAAYRLRGNHGMNALVRAMYSW